MQKGKLYYLKNTPNLIVLCTVDGDRNDYNFTGTVVGTIHGTYSIGTHTDEWAVDQFEELTDALIEIKQVN